MRVEGFQYVLGDANFRACWSALLKYVRGGFYIFEWGGVRRDDRAWLPIKNNHYCNDVVEFRERGGFKGAVENDAGFSNLRGPLFLFCGMALTSSFSYKALEPGLCRFCAVAPLAAVGSSLARIFEDLFEGFEGLALNLKWWSGKKFDGFLKCS
ncbi:hypothetical protein AVEN_235016-1 [Araneus ventricosus]|uniref:Uncharacterized protein n=1 Tax=Araneus ventricosus TaxID=182803 RepID=A0A4Y2FP02_ARAVE|nr:hypothetical protein AVEN_235016-1 [Araneus ventricosus]